MVYAPPRDGYAVFCQREVTPAVDLGEAARRLAEAYRKGWECRVMACPTVHQAIDRTRDVASGRSDMTGKSGERMFVYDAARAEVRLLRESNRPLAISERSARLVVLPKMPCGN